MSRGFERNRAFGPPWRLAEGPLIGGPFEGGRGRRRRGDVRAALLLALAEEPRNGYQVMQAIEERSGGRWRPSPGAVYPALALLEDEGLIRAVERDGAKLYELTDAGRSHLSERHDAVPPWAGEEEASTLGELKRQLHQIHAAATQVVHAGSQDQIERAGATLAEARRGLYRILAEDTDD